MNQLHILHLYPNELNTYGDHGNVLTLRRRIEHQGMQAVIHYHRPGSKLPQKVDMVIGGGGQDSAQADVQADILRIGGQLHKLSEARIPMLLICGTYQLFGRRYKTAAGHEVKGIGVFDAETIGGDKRMIGNVMVRSEFGVLFGFENHSGQTYLGSRQAPLGRVIRGGGNNGKDKTEGARTNNVFGSYLHGPLLPNNPQFGDELINMAALNKYGDFKLQSQTDHLALLTRRAARRRRY